MVAAVPTPQPAEEQELLRRLRAGDRAAFGALVARHGGAMLRLARSLVKSAAVAEEVVQDAWLSALDALASFEGRSSLRTWLFRIVVNKARSRA
jgi:RNA polymerase sigma-70 factor (ECF subfamily)